jgi:hypothetical protein
MRAGLALLFLVAVGGAASAAERGHWMRDHFTGEWLVGTGAWRTSIGVDTHAPGFDVFGGGGELDLGLEVGSGLGIVASGRVLTDGTYLEWLGGLGLQMHVSDRVRLRASPAAGQAIVKGDKAVLVGGFVTGSVDLYPFGSGRVASTIALRFDVDGVVGGGKELPDSSIALSLGVGLRY